MRNVLVTGANRGLGLDFVRQLAGFSSETLNIIATCREPTKAQALEEIKRNSPRVKVHILKLEVTNEAEVGDLLSAVQALLGVDETLTLLINNAGVLPLLPLESLTRAAMASLLDVNVISPLLITRELLPSLSLSAKKSREQGSAASAVAGGMSCSKAAVVSITSLLGSLGAPTPHNFSPEFRKVMLPYRSSKAALNMCMEGVSHETAPLEVLVCLLHPGWVATDMGGPAAPVTPEESVREMLQTMASWDQSHHGGFFDRSGERIPW